MAGGPSPGTPQVAGAVAGVPGRVYGGVPGEGTPCLGTSSGYTLVGTQSGLNMAPSRPRPQLGHIVQFCQELDNVAPAV